MKTLIAIPSCHTLRHFEQAERDTWLRDVPAGTDYKFFLGNPAGAAEPDEVFLNVGDTLQDLTHKTVEMYRWSVENEYDYVLKVDLDTFVRPQAWLESDFRDFDWTGGQNSFFASGGAGYVLSRRAMQAVVNHPVEPGPAEDVNTAHAVLEAGMTLHNDSRYKFCPGDVLCPTDLTYHLSSVKAWGAKATTEDMYRAYAGTFALPKPEVIEQRWLRRPR
jgi:hypothetical protein